jgi:hypothetical protein
MELRILQYGDCHDDSMTSKQIFGNAAHRKYSVISN